MNDKTLDLAKKLKALADRGVGGEKENATQMLEKYMHRHNISISDIDGVKIIDHEFWLEDDRKRFFIQVASSVLGKGFEWGTYKYKRKRVPGKERRYIKCSDSDFIEIMAKYDFYYKDYIEQMDLFHSAFIQKNHLYAKATGDTQDEQPELTPEEKARLLRLYSLMNGIEAKPFLKQLT